MVADLRDWGWTVNKIELAIGFSERYVYQLNKGNITHVSYQNGARLYNFWESERELASRRLLQNPAQAVTT